MPLQWLFDDVEGMRPILQTHADFDVLIKPWTQQGIFIF